MNIFNLFVCISIFALPMLGQTLPICQSFEESISDNWNFTTNPAAFNSDGDVWDRVSDTGEYFSPAPDGTNFWEFYDIDAIPGVPEDKVCHLIFDTIDLSTQQICTFSFSYCNRSLDSTDYMSYTVAFNNSNNWDIADEVILPKHEEDLCAWHTVYILIPADAQYCRLRLSAKANYSADCGGFDNIQLIAGETILPELVIQSPADGNFCANCISNIAISGTATNISGMIVWSNEFNDVSGEIAATSKWSIASITLTEGNNNISVTATNENGLNVTDSINILRGKSFSSAHLGSIAFVGFNTSTDSFSFAVLKSLPAGTVIRFTDEEWGGTDFSSETIETDLVWSNTVQTAAGTIVEFYECDSASTISNNIGVIISGRQDLSQAGEGIIAYYGPAEREPSAFLAAISSNNGNLTGTGLTYGETAVNIPQTPKSLYYCGIRSNKQMWSSYLPLINSDANWEGTEGVTESWGCCAAFSCNKAGAVMLVK
ncbi:MAG: hypothetical protein PF904_02495 [Kiritimatiellae bacterium]|jgi:hypothetical protein|nr:hypothetical protein [Kiritimatiellia bacterium]